MVTLAPTDDRCWPGVAVCRVDHAVNVTASSCQPGDARVISGAGDLGFRAGREFLRARGGWTTSIPGDREMRFDALVGSPLPDQLAALGYIVEKIGESQRIVSHAVAQRFEVSSSGGLTPTTEGSTKPVKVKVANAGIATVEQYDLRMP
jgi:hypothetical protein